MNFSGWQLHPLQGELAGQWAVKVNGNWRIIFAFDGQDAILVDYRDYQLRRRTMRMYNPPHPGGILKEALATSIPMQRQRVRQAYWRVPG